MSEFAPRSSGAPAFAGVRARPGQKFAVSWVKQRLRSIHRDARAAGRDSPLNEAAAHLYLLIATFVLDGRFISEPMRLQELAAIMHCEPITVRRARKKLAALRELRLIEGGQGNSDVRFEMVRMGGPLYAEKGGASVADQPGSQRSKYAAASISQSEVIGDQPGSHGWKYAATSIRESEVAADRYIPLEEEENNLLLGSQVDEERAAFDAAVEQTDEQVAAFCRWWTDTYPRHNDGVSNSVRQCDRDAAFSLLCAPRTVERVQAMAIELWATTADEHRGSDRSFIANSDRSIRVLLEKETFVERQVVRRAGTGSTCPHDPICTFAPDCTARVIAEGRAERARKSG